LGTPQTPAVFCCTSSVIPAEAGIQDISIEPLAINPLDPPFLGENKRIKVVGAHPQTLARKCPGPPGDSSWERVLAVGTQRKHRQEASPCTSVANVREKTGLEDTPDPGRDKFLAPSVQRVLSGPRRRRYPAAPAARHSSAGGNPGDVTSLCMPAHLRNSPLP
jgi:hypothetical protein